jgi:hypothetical protein
LTDAAAEDPVHHPAEEYARALVTASDALLAIQATQARALACGDGALRGILDAQLIQQKEVLVMVLEWLRQQDAVLDSHMRGYLFQRADEPAPVEEPLAEVPEAPAPVVMPEPVAAAPSVPITTPAKGLPLTLPNQRIRG